ncbi:MAG TPA: hypothetical protein VHE10_03875 [Candidatus Paceibacterota bacterium]|nr:hypothetical protein [Candidatus Paceibacterota bacterium]
MKATFFAIGMLVIIASAVAAGVMHMPKALPADSTLSTSSAKAMPIEDYVKLYISELSPVKETLGGRFSVTDIEARGGAGTVSYEDGHNAYVADFTYSISDIGGVDVNSFALRD